MELVVFMLHVKRSDRGFTGSPASFDSFTDLRNNLLKITKTTITNMANPLSQSLLCFISVRVDLIISVRVDLNSKGFFFFLSFFLPHRTKQEIHWGSAKDVHDLGTSSFQHANILLNILKIKYCLF